MAVDLQSGFRIGEFEVLPLLGRVIGADADHKLQPKIIDVLLCLAAADGQVVSRQDIHETVWGNVIVTDDALNRCISELRRTFGDQRGKTAYIETAPKRGYRLAKQVSPLDGSNTQPPKPVDNGPPTLDSAAARVAVLPFECLTPDSSNAFLAEALPTALHSGLARLNRVRVTSRRSSFAIETEGLQSQDVGQQLNAQYVISGSVAEAGQRIRVIVEVDDAEAGVMLWSQRYELSGDDVLDFETQLTDAVIGAFGGQRLRSEITRAQSGQASELDAWSMVQRARNYLVGYRASALQEARALMAEAVEKDPGYALAHAMHGLVIAENLINGLSNDMDADTLSTESAVQTALKLAPHDPAVLRSAGCALAYCGNWQEALTTLRRAVKSAPFDFGAWGYLGWPLVASGKSDDLKELLDICDRLLQTSPDHPGAPYWYYHRSVALGCLDQMDTALQAAADCLAVQPKFALGHWHHSNLLGLTGDTEAAVKAAARANEANAHLSAEVYQKIINRINPEEETRQKRLSGLQKAGLLD